MEVAVAALALRQQQQHLRREYTGEAGHAMPPAKVEEGELSLKMRTQMKSCERGGELEKTRSWRMRSL